MYGRAALKVPAARFDRGTLIVHLGMTGHLRVTGMLRPRDANTITLKSSSRTAPPCATTIPGGSAPCYGRQADPLQHERLAALGPSLLTRALTRPTCIDSPAGARSPSSRSSWMPRSWWGLGTSTPAKPCFRAGIAPAGTAGTSQQSCFCAPGASGPGDPR